MNTSKIGIIGVGPVGSILAAHLIRAGHDVTVIDVFREHLSKMREDKLIIDGSVSLEVQVQAAFTGVAETALAGMTFDVIFICVKATAIGSFVQVVPKILTPDGVVICFQNGMDTEKEVLAVVGSERTLRGVVNYAGNLTGIGRIEMTFFNAPNHLGPAVPGAQPADRKASEIADLLTAAKLACHFAPNIKRYVWEKVIRNAAIMPISALTGMDMSQVMASEHGKAVARALLQESLETAIADGFRFGPSFLDESLQYFEKAGRHTPSMLEDVRDGRRTEIEFLNQKVAEYGRKFGIETPFSTAVSQLILCIDELAAQRQRKSD